MCLARVPGATAQVEVVLKIAVIFDALHPEWEDAAFKREVEETAEKAEPAPKEA